MGSGCMVTERELLGYVSIVSLINKWNRFWQYWSNGCILQ